MRLDLAPAIQILNHDDFEKPLEMRPPDHARPDPFACFAWHSGLACEIYEIYLPCPFLLTTPAFRVCPSEGVEQIGVALELGDEGLAFATHGVHEHHLGILAVCYHRFQVSHEPGAPLGQQGLN